MSRSVRIQDVRVVRESIGPGGKVKTEVSYEKCNVSRIDGVETVRIDGQNRPLTKFGVKVPADALAKAP